MSDIEKRSTVVKVGFIVAGADGLQEAERQALVDFAERRSGLSRDTVEGIERAAAGGLAALTDADVATLRSMNRETLSSVLHEACEKIASADGHFSEAENEALKSIWRRVTA